MFLGRQLKVMEQKRKKKFFGSFLKLSSFDFVAQLCASVFNLNDLNATLFAQCEKVFASHF